MASRKELMGMDSETLKSLGQAAGLHFNSEMSKSQMVMRLEEHHAAKWMESFEGHEHESIHQEEAEHLVSDGMRQSSHEKSHGLFEDVGSFRGSEDLLISDAAKVAIDIHNAGFSNTFHNSMYGSEEKHSEQLHAMMRHIGVSADDVLLHLPKYDHNLSGEDKPFNFLKSHFESNWDDLQDIMPKIAGHYAGDILKEYSTDKGSIQDSYNYLAHMYLDKSGYSSRAQYDKDLIRVSQRLKSSMEKGFLEVAHNAANLTEENKQRASVSYASLLPEIGDSSIVHGTHYPREKLNAAGLPMGSTGSAVGDRTQYSLVATLLGRPETKADGLRNHISDTLKSMAGVYKGGSDSGLNPRAHVTSDYDAIMDSATRYTDIENARSGYANLDDDKYTSANIRSVIENNYDRLDSVQPKTFDPAAALRPLNTGIVKQPQPSSPPEVAKPSEQSSTQFRAEFVQPTSYNAARERREQIAIANLDSQDHVPEPSPVQFHDEVAQGTDEWLNIRKQYDFTGSTVGSFLGHNKYTKPWAEMVDKIGVIRGDGPSDYQQSMFDRGHKLEEQARPKVAKQFGLDIQQTGYVTNSNYPNMMYSPDGLIGDDAIWEHKALVRRKNFYGDLRQDNEAYYDQLQMGMMLTGRSRALYSETRGRETRSQWIDAEPGWYERNRTKLESTSRRLQAGRQWLEDNPGHEMDSQFVRAGARRAVVGSGLWRDVTQGDNGRFNSIAGTQHDEFLRASDYSSASQPSNSDYKPNFTTDFVATPSQDDSQNPAAQSVKQGILLAREEIKREQASSGGGSGRGGSGGGDGGMFGGEDADFDDFLHSGRGWSGKRIREAIGDDGSKGGGYQALLRGLRDGVMGGSLGTLQGGFMRGLTNSGPIGQTAALAVRAAGIVGEGVSTMNDYFGNAQDFGVSNPIAFDSMQQGMEMMGLNEKQAQSANQNIHSAYNRLANGDPSSAVSISVATRGLITLDDIRTSGGDPTKLAAIFRQRAKARGWSDARIAGAAEMSGLAGFARLAHTSDSIMSDARNNVADREDTDTHIGSEASRRNNSTRAYVSTDYATMRLTERGYEFGQEATSYIKQHANDMASAVGGVVSDARLDYYTAQLESGGRDYDSHGNPIRGGKGKDAAMYAMQVKPSVARDPGLKAIPSLGLAAVVPARDNSAAESNRVGRDMLHYYNTEYGGDIYKAAAAYTNGDGAVHKAIKEYGDNWLSHMPAQAQKRVADIKTLEAGASKFAADGYTKPSVGTLNVNNYVTVNGQTTKTATTVAGHSQSQEINTRGSVQQRR